VSGPAYELRTCQDAVDFLEEALDYEKMRRWSYNRRSLNLSRTRDLLVALGNPHRRYRVIHVAGTKGKGTTAGAAAHILTAMGLRTGLLTSPHLVTHRERIRVDGQMIGPHGFLRGVLAMQPHVQHKRDEEAETTIRAPTYFELLTGLGLHFFAEQKADWAVVEVGLGGRLDSTNVVSPECCVVTNIGFDHTDKLGDTAEEIALEKAGIFKDGVPVVIGRQQYPDALAALREAAEARGCPYHVVGEEITVNEPRPMAAPPGEADAPVGWRFGLSTPLHTYDDVFTPLLGRHQLDNLAAAVGAVEAAAERTGQRLAWEEIAPVISRYQIEGRMEVLQRAPEVILDVAHTIESMDALLSALGTHFPGRPLRVVFGCSAGKKVRGMLHRLRSRCASITLTEAKNPRAMAADKVERVARAVGLEPPEGLRVVPDSPEALEAALSEADAGDVVCVTGSFFTAGEIREKWLETHAGYAAQSSSQ